MSKLTPKEIRILSFEDKELRSIEHEGEMWYVVNDVVEAITESKDVKQYVKRMRSRDEELASVWDNITLALPFQTTGGVQNLVCSNQEGFFRIFQSIRSKRLEPFKLWLAQVGKERIEEIENPVLAIERARQYYKELGYDEEWINTRLKSIEIRELLTDEWKERGISEGLEYAILTAEIAKATFGLLPSEHKKLKGLKKENLRDHMNNLELIFTMLGEEVTRQNAQENDAQGFDENRKSAIEGGKAAGESRRALEKQTGNKVVSPVNFKAQIKQAKENKNLDKGTDNQ